MALVANRNQLEQEFPVDILIGAMMNLRRPLLAASLAAVVVALQNQFALLPPFRASKVELVLKGSFLLDDKVFLVSSYFGQPTRFIESNV